MVCLAMSFGLSEIDAKGQAVVVKREAECCNRSSRIFSLRRTIFILASVKGIFAIRIIAATTQNT
jgi:hypothetical protein